MRPRACSNGTYNDALNASHSGQCKPCKKNYFNDKTGQKECRLCGEGTAKEIGSDLCTCEGLNRVFKVRKEEQFSGEPWFNESLYNEVLGIANNILQPGLLKCMKQNLNITKQFS